MKSFFDSVLGFIFSQHALWADIMSFFRSLGTWIWDHQMIILGLVIIFCIFMLIVMRLRRRYHNIRKLWVFILFFLTKRQMFIPLVYTLAKDQPGFASPKLEELLAIRQHCRETSLRHSPRERLALEKKVSRTLFEYFSYLESQNKIQRLSKFGHVVRDLEFIDAKLVELQKLYNLEAKRWNLMSLTILGGLPMRLLGMTPFDLFTD